MKIELQQLISQHQIISFDIFDTLLYRPFVKPEDVFVFLEKQENRPGYAQLRIKAEYEARKKVGFSREVTLEEIRCELPASFFDVFAKELPLEKKLLRPINEGLAAFRYALEIGKKVIIISDMYMPKHFLMECLEKNGITGFANLLVSSELKVRKFDGKLFEYFLEKEKCQPYNILHIGDNLNSDVVQPSKLGIHTFYFEKKIEALFRTKKFLKEFYEKSNGSLDASIICSLLCFCPLHFEDYWAEFGYKIAGPVYLAFAVWILTSCTEKNSKILFLMRDGYYLKKTVEIINPTSEIENILFYAPRNASIACQLDFEKYLGVSSGVGLAVANALIKYCKKKYSIFKSENSIENISELQSFLNKNKQMLLEIKEKETNAYYEYLTNLDLYKKTVYLVDSFTQGFSAQTLLKKFEAPLSYKTIGLYWRTEISPQDSSLRFKTFQKEHQNSFLDWNLMEFILSAPLPPIELVDEAGSPIFGSLGLNSSERIKKHPMLWFGAENFIENYKSHFEEYLIDFKAETITNLINELLKHPENEDLIQFSNLKHAWDPAHRNYVPLPSMWYTQSVDQPEPREFLEQEQTLKRKLVKKIIYGLIHIPGFKLISYSQGHELKFLKYIKLASFKKDNLYKTYKLMGITIRKRKN